MYESDQKTEKWKVEIQVELNDGTSLLGAVFVTPTQRISELLNDHRQFLPVLTSDGLIVHLRKTTIAKLVQLDQAVERDSVRDPYEILGVSRNISGQDLKDAYHNLCTVYHPDKLLALNMSPEFVDLANSRTIRIIDAYRRILTARNGSAADEKDRKSSFHPAS